jgi:hypothetical protein
MPQKSTPTVDVSNNFWSPPPVADQVKEATPDDSTLASTGPNPQGASFEVKLKGLAVPDKGPHILTVRLRELGTGGLPVAVALLQGSQIITVSSATPGAAFVNGFFVVTLTDAEAARITDYTDLRVRVIAGRLSVPCRTTGLPAVLNGTFTNKSGVFTRLPDSIKMFFENGAWMWDGTGVVCSLPSQLALFPCSGGSCAGLTGFTLASGATVIGPPPQPPDASPPCVSSPLSLTFTVSGNFGCGAGGYTLTVTE